MRVTTNMITNNAMLYLNKNKENMLNLNQQYTTGKKINRPSDDPISATRALKLRTDVSEIKQYERNTGDAVSWMDTTEQAFNNIIEMTKRIRTLCVQGSSDTNTYEEREKILEEIKQLKQQIAQEGNVSYAGRYVFSGFRTDKPLIYAKTHNEKVEIEQKFTSKDIKQKDIILDKTPPEEVKAYRIRLGYTNIKENKNVQLFTKNASGNIVQALGGSYNIIEKKSTEDDAYKPAQAGEIHFLKDTGELIFYPDDAKTIIKDADFSAVVDYEKDTFSVGEQDPTHYYKTYNDDEVKNLTVPTTSKQIKLPNIPVRKDSVTLDLSPLAVSTIKYANSGDAVSLGANEVRVDMDTGILTFDTNLAGATVSDIKYQYIINDDNEGKIKQQNINYEISINQSISVNSLGKDVLTTDFLRDIEETVNNTQKTLDKIKNLEYQIEQNPTNDLKQRLALQKDISGKFFKKMMGNIDNSLKVTVKEQTKLGSKMKRLELTKNRLASDNLNFTELLSNTEDVDLAEIVMKVKNQEMIYNASLMSMSKVIQPSLLDFIR